MALKTLKPGANIAASSAPPAQGSASAQSAKAPSPAGDTRSPKVAEAVGRSIRYTVFGTEYQAPNASIALADVLRLTVKDNEAKLPELAEAVQSRKRNHIARSPLEISPHRPDLARAAQIVPGWLVGLNIANREKMMIIRAACKIYGISIPGDVMIELPNA